MADQNEQEVERQSRPARREAITLYAFWQRLCDPNL
jgi:hypothetical protein